MPRTLVFLSLLSPSCGGAATTTTTASPTAATCPGDILAEVGDNACLEPAVLGDSVVKACGAALEARHYVLDPEAARVIGEQSGKKIVCYRGEHQPALELGIVDRLMPRIVPAGYPNEPTIVRAPFVTGLEIVFVVDFNDKMRFVTQRDLAEQALSLDDLVVTSLKNLTRVSHADVARTVLSTNVAQVMPSGDGYAAARLLLVPRALRPGEELAALIPERDILILAPVPADGDWSKLREVAAHSAGESALYARPLRVTAQGFEPR